MTRFDALSQIKREQPSLSDIIRAIAVALFFVAVFGVAVLA